MERVQADHPNADVEVWSEDEHRIGLHPMVRRLWVEQGEQPVATVNWKREWLWLYAFVQQGGSGGGSFPPGQIASDRTYQKSGFCHMSTPSCLVVFSKILPSTSAWVGTNALFCPYYQAGWHTSEQLEVPEGIHLVSLPPYSPELQPAERLWPLVDEPLANQAFKTLDEAEELVFQRCRRLLQQQQLIQGLT